MALQKLDRSSFFMAIIGSSLLFHFWRFPHLVTSNGGGAFLIVFMLALFVVGLPLIVAEMALGKKRSVQSHPFMRFYSFIQYALSHCLFLYFLFIGSLAAVYFIYFSLRMAGVEDLAQVSSFHPSLGFRLTATLGLLFLLAISLKQHLDDHFERLIRFCTPICIIIFIFILSRVFSIGSRWEGLRTLFYPDFFQLTSEAIIQAIGHALITLLFGIGWLKSISLRSEKYDLVELGIQAGLISIILGVFSGLMALPMVEQLSETPFGADWLFSVLPRWMLYGSFGNYYCSLFFAALFLLSFFLLRLTGRLSLENLERYPKFYFGHLNKVFFIGNILLVLGLTAMFYEKGWAGWLGQGPLLKIDQLFVDFLVPLEALLLLGMLFSVTTYSERKLIFAKQKVFYHIEYFYILWRFCCRWLIPFLILAGWALVLL